ncbi:transducin family protein / WD-40 repeat family protein isoform X2 [Tasmannia lanceolata]
MRSELDGHGHLAIGLSDNSVCLWDISGYNLVLEVKCPERCLLYSMRLWGDNINALRVASGTIYNQIIVWKLVSQRHTSSSATSVKESNRPDSSCRKSGQFLGQQYRAMHLSRLIGHEGSIFRIAWSTDGSKLMSVSDDRSARIWIISAQNNDSDDLKEVFSIDISVGPVLFGHNARIWDCYISDSIIITAGEDCTCRVWHMDGDQLMMIKEHTGRGIWRCLYDPSTALLVTAGFDSAIKVHPLNASTLKDTPEQNGVVKEFKERTEIFTICTPSLPQHLGLMDSKSEYVRCLHFAREDILYVATNHGYVHHVKLSEPGNVKWTELVQVSGEVPIICMDFLSTKYYGASADVEDWIAIGDGNGNAMVVRIIPSSAKVALSFCWSAEKERQLLGIYWCKSLGCSHLFTADPRGRLKLWRLGYASGSVSDEVIVNHEPSLIGEFTSCFGTRIMCLDALFEEEVLVCGDQRGNLIVFTFSKSLLLAHCIESEAKIPALTYFKGAHGISNVGSIFITTSNFNQVEIRSTGGDGCICYFKYDRDWQSLEFTGMKQVKELSLIQSVFANANFVEDLEQGNYAIGFASTDFIIWNLINDTKILLVPCGGWRRPHSYFLGNVPEIQSCFAYLKDHTIHIHRLWVPAASERRIFPQVLHTQYHGREIHSLCFVSSGLQLNPYKSSDPFLGLSWIATGCEDGSVRLTRYTPETESWSASKLLGEHVGGSAVRSICFVSMIYTSSVGQTCTPDDGNRYNTTSDSRDNHLLLISVGAKQVLTSWLIRNRKYKEAALGEGVHNAENGLNHSSKENSSVSFQWLSTHMPPKFVSTRKSIETTEKTIGQEGNVSVVRTSPTSRSNFMENKETMSKYTPGEKNENDWRYLAVTAFLVKGADCRLTVCFVVVACSDATLTLRALLLPCRLWFDVALLVPQTTPVLALQHVVIPRCAPFIDNVQRENAYIVISGSTDGSITFWDLTETVEHFMQCLSMLQPEKLIDCQRRPRTGRGSQGGRWWKSLTNQSLKAVPRDSMDTSITIEDTNGHTIDQARCKAPSKLDVPVNSPTVCSQSNNGSFPGSEIYTDGSSIEIHELQPLHVIQSVHQSGVNCLHVSNTRDPQRSGSEPLYYVLSGGDDQALHCLVFCLKVQLTVYDTGPRQHSDLTNHKLARPVSQPSEMGSMRKSSLQIGNEYSFRFLYQERIASAHSSAVKGVWTDGTWVFSTGLDQRVRCWHINECGKLIEHSYLIVSVPEPETLEARFCDRNHYQIAVAGRGMQLVEFSAS